MKFYLLLLLSCAWLALDVAKSDSTLEYTLNEAGCTVFLPNNYVKSCKLDVNDDMMDDNGMVHSLTFEMELLTELDNSTEFNLDVMQDGVPTGMSMHVSLVDLVKKGDALTDEFCSLINIPKGKLPIERGVHKNDNHTLSEKILPPVLQSGTYNISFQMLTGGEPVIDMFVLAEAFSS